MKLKLAKDLPPARNLSPEELRELEAEEREIMKERRRNRNTMNTLSTDDDDDTLNTKPTWQFGSFDGKQFVYWGFPGHDWHYVVTQPLFAIPITHLILRPHPTHPGHFIKAFDVLQDAFDWCNLKQDSLHSLAKGFAGVFTPEEGTTFQFPDPVAIQAYDKKLREVDARKAERRRAEGREGWQGGYIGDLGREEGPATEGEQEPPDEDPDATT